ncbi:hypothetical protein HPB52_007261 [Rhipicephalus sanguineus]|uniref:Uncharacterized protein n=1 Tax=Rhipicephalus sanguineus TaxID=34632 RepID=A0A9D4SRS1_RHISA|nr:hypothetical protein HPB52_007261 [Rhipicephalus sanguineus]
MSLLTRQQITAVTDGKLEDGQKVWAQGSAVCPVLPVVPSLASVTDAEKRRAGAKCPERGNNGVHSAPKTVDQTQADGHGIRGHMIATLPLHDESLAEEGGFSQGSPAQGILEAMARGEVQDEPGSEGCSSPLPVVAPESSGNSASASTPSETEEAASSCEAGLDGNTEKEPEKRK